MIRRCATSECCWATVASWSSDRTHPTMCGPHERSPTGALSRRSQSIVLLRADCEGGGPSEDNSATIWPEHPVFHTAPSVPTCPVPTGSRTTHDRSVRRFHGVLLRGQGASHGSRAATSQHDDAVVSTPKAERYKVSIRIVRFATQHVQSTICRAMVSKPQLR